MSESDDTDILLLIPPDFYIVHSSDSEESIESEIKEKCDKNYGFEKLVVNNLISHVNELENRISKIESNSITDLSKNKWDSDYLTQSFDFPLFFGTSNFKSVKHEDISLKSQSMFLTGFDKYDRSINSLRREEVLNSGNLSFQAIPVKHKQFLSLPSTPIANKNNEDNIFFPNFNTTRNNTYSSPKKSAILIEPMTPSEIQSMSCSEGNNKVLKNVNDEKISTIVKDKETKSTQNNKIIGEIDEFLDSVRTNSKDQPKISMADHSKQLPYIFSGTSANPELNFIVKDSSNLPVREQVYNYMYPNEEIETKSLKELDINEVDHLLQEIEKEDLKLKNNSDLQPCQQKYTYRCGDNTDSIPDLGYGLRSFNNLPVKEEVIKRKSIVPLEGQSQNTEIKSLDLSDIEKLLKQMESTQTEIEKRLQIREAALGKNNALQNNVITHQKTSLVGDNIGSVPDRGFGIRNLMKSDPQNISLPDGKLKPVHEETITKRNVSLLGSESMPCHIENSETHKSNNMQVPIRNHLKHKLELADASSSEPMFKNGNPNSHKSNESLLYFPYNISHSTSITKPQVTQDNGRSDLISSDSADGHIQGDYLPSVPDLGFGLRNLWASSRQQQGFQTNIPTYIPKILYSSDQQNKTEGDLDAVEYSLLPQIQPHSTAAEMNQPKFVDYSVNQDDKRMKDQKSSLVLEQRESVNNVTDKMAEKKSDFTLDSGQGDAAIIAGTGNRRQFIRDISKADSRSSFLDSGLVNSASYGTSSLLSLSELWDKEGVSSSLQMKDKFSGIRLKFEEEKYRREHCERLIHELQSRLLEEQQKIAVAVRVDTAKDQAIKQLQSAWNRLAHHWKELEEHRHNLANVLQNERQTNQKKETETAQKIKRLESEISKALDLAQGYKDKFDIIEREKIELVEYHKIEIRELSDKIQERDLKLEDINKHHALVMKENNDYMEKVRFAEEETQKERKFLIDSQRELKEIHKKFDSLEAQLSVVKEEKELVQLKLKEEKGRISILDQQKKSLQSAVDESKKKEKSLKEEIKQLQIQIEKTKVELREYYQDQLEVVVQDKLKEFQEQLDTAESSLHKELEQQQQVISEMASKQIKQISEKHQLELQLLEEKHAEELQLYKLQLNQAAQQINQLETKLQGYNNRKSEIVERLHDVMETQWQEALRIISGNSPLVDSGSNHTKLQVNNASGNMRPAATSERHTNLDKPVIISPKEQTNTRLNDASGLEINEKNVMKISKFEYPTIYNMPIMSDSSRFKELMPSQQHVPPLHFHQQSSSSSLVEDTPFNRDGLLTYRVAENPSSNVNPSVCMDYFKANQEDELKKYIMMLLERSPGNPLAEQTQFTESRQGNQEDKQNYSCNVETNKRQECLDIPKTEEMLHSKWEKILHSESGSRYQKISSVPNCDYAKPYQGASKDGQLSKPPWK